MNLTLLTTSQFKRIARLLRKKEILQRRVAGIDRALASFDAGKPAVKRGRKPGRRKMSAATRAKMAAAARARWAKIKAAKG
jgi:hypothetical protein